MRLQALPKRHFTTESPCDDEFDLDYAVDLRDNHPEIWGLYDTQTAREAFDVLLGTRSSKPEFWAWRDTVRADCFNWNTSAGVVAQLHYGFVGVLGMDGMKAVIDPLKFLKEQGQLTSALECHRRDWAITRKRHGAMPPPLAKDASGTALQPMPDHYQRGLQNTVKQSVDTESRICSFSFSSQAPVERWDWWYGRYYEILSHESGDYDFRRLNDGGAFLWNHNRDDQRGVVEAAWVENGRAYCKVRFSSSPLGQELMQDMADGIKTCVSFAYDPKVSVLVKTDENDCETWRVIDWEAFEVSSVSIPADPSVGLGRSQSQSKLQSTISISESKRGGMAEVVDKDDVIQQERDRVVEITQLGQWKDMGDLAQKAIGEGWSVDEFKSEVLSKEREMTKTNSYYATRQSKSWGDSYGLSRRESNDFSVTRAIAASISNDWSKAGLERSLSEHLRRSAHRDRGGLHLPIQALHSRAVQKLGSGANLVEESVLGGGYIDLLRSRCLVQSLGATLLNDLEGDISIPCGTGDTQSFWVPESGDVTESTPTFDAVKLSPKTVGSMTRYSRLMILQGSPDVESLVRNILSNSIAQAIDRAAIAGTGTNDEPRGILNTPGIGLVAIGTNGGQLTYSHVLALESALATSNADVGRLGFLTNPRVRSRLKQTLQNPSATDAGWIWESMAMTPEAMMSEGASTWGQVGGYLAGASTNVPSNLTKGSGSNLSAMIFANWSDLLIGTWGTIELLPNPYEADAYSRGDVLMRVFASVDVAVRHPESFAICRDIVTA